MSAVSERRSDLLESDLDVTRTPSRAFKKAFGIRERIAVMEVKD